MELAIYTVVRERLQQSAPSTELELY